MNHPVITSIETRKVKDLHGKHSETTVIFRLPDGRYSEKRFENEIILKIDRLLRRMYKKNPQQ